MGDGECVTSINVRGGGILGGATLQAETLLESRNNSQASKNTHGFANAHKFLLAVYSFSMSGCMVTIRIAQSSDLDMARSLTRESFQSVRGVYRPRPKSIRNPNSHAIDETKLIASLDNQDVGTATLIVRGDVLCVVGLGVLTPFRGRGVARQLLHRASAEARAQGCTTVRLQTIRQTGNEVIFQKLGFHWVHEETARWCVSDRFDVLHEVTMERLVN